MDRDKLYKHHIVDAAEKIRTYVSDVNLDQFAHNQLLIDAVLRNLQIIGEAAKRLSEDFKNSKKEIPWKKVTGMRDVIIHDYTDVSIKIVWDTVTVDLPPLEKLLRSDLEDRGT